MMVYKMILTMGLCLLGIFQVAAQHRNMSYATRFVRADQGMVFIRSDGFGNTEQEAILDAERNIFNVLFTQGYPGSPQQTRLISESDIVKNPGFIDSFLAEKRFKPFINSSATITPLGKISDKKLKDPVSGKKETLPRKKLTADVGINLSALRKHLEDSQIIKKFGY